MDRNIQPSSIEHIRLSAIKLYINGLPILVGTLKNAVTTETQYILDRLANLLPKCDDASTALSLFSRSVTTEEFQEFIEIVGETKSLLAKVDLNTLYDC